MPDMKTFAIGTTDEMVTITPWRDGLIIGIEDEEGRHVAFLSAREAVDLSTALLAAAASAA